MLPSTRHCIAMVLRANHQIGTGHLMRLRSLIPYLKQHAIVRLYIYAIEEKLRPLCNDYDEIFCFTTKEEILNHLLDLPLDPQEQLCFQTDASASTKTANIATITSKSANTDCASNHSNHTATEYLPQILIIDDYAIDKSFEAPLYKRCKLFVVDDLFNRPHQCHMLLDQSLKTHEKDYRTLCNLDCQLLLGSSYSLTSECFYIQYSLKHYQEQNTLASTDSNNADHRVHSHLAKCSCIAHKLPLCERVRQFWQELAEHPPIAASNTANTNAKNATNKEAPLTSSSPYTTNQTLPHVLVNFGGADPVGACLKISKSIVQAQLYQCYVFTMLSGAANPDYEAIQALINTIPEQWQKNFCLIRHCTNVSDLLLRHDLAIGAYGGMYRERISAGLPSLGVIIADNQAGTDKIIEHYQLGLNLKLSELSDPQAIARALDTLYQNRHFFTKNCLKIYDGHGLQRIVQAILSLLPT